MKPLSVGSLLSGAWLVLMAPWAYADGIFQSVTGVVATSTPQSRQVIAAKDQRVLPGTTITTGGDGQAVIRFDDGQLVVVNANTEFKVASYRFNKDKPSDDSVVFELVKGAMRSISGLIASRSRSAYSLHVPQATIGIRGTDFMVVLVNPAYVSVTQGAVAATNAAGSVSFGAGSIGSIASSTSLATSISASALPSAASGAFSQMGAVNVGAAGGAASGATGAGAAGGTTAGISAGAIAAGAVAAGVAAAGGGGGGSGSTTTHTTTTHH